ncbi:MAG: hypothetical protein LCH74_09600 [Proteobacteria bacterium]|nr:hypothetical protein [Pseudomonadota bacterium]
MSGPAPFQQRTADIVIRRFWKDRTPARRFLVADEVGLGKTVVAKRVVEEALERAGRRHVDIVYLCSSQPVASQNLKRLKADGAHGRLQATRLTLLASEKRDAGVRYLALTPATSFNVTASSGSVDERALIFCALRPHFPGKGLKQLLQQVSEATWDDRIGRLKKEKPEQSVIRAFAGRVLSDDLLAADLRRAIGGVRQLEDVDDPKERRVLRRARNALVGRLRKELADCSAATLAGGGLVIVDEFQKFAHLLDRRRIDTDHAVRLAATLLGEEVPDRRVLLLSATPYRLPGRQSDMAEKSYDDFVGLMRFLGGDKQADLLAGALDAFDHALRAPQPDSAAVIAARDRAQSLLRRVMSRTERTQSSGLQDAMVVPDVRVLASQDGDLTGALATRRLSKLLKTRDGIDYWKSAPYFLEFMRGYQFRTAAVAAIAAATEATPDALEARAIGRTVGREGRTGGLLLDHASVRAMEKLEPSSARMRDLVERALPPGAERLLWVPPALPYMKLGGAFADAPKTLKHLVFTEWRVAPDAISAIASYEAERRLAADFRMMRGRRRRAGKRAAGQNHAAFGKLGDMLRLGRSRQGRRDPTAGMAALSLLLPSRELADIGDPLQLALRSGRALERREAIEAAKASITQELGKLPRGAGRVDQRWYWAAPILLDQRDELTTWLSGDHPDDDEFAVAAAAVRKVLNNPGILGARPKDLASVLARLSIAAPGNCAYRAVRRTLGTGLPEPALRSAAFRIARGFQGLFNHGDAAAAVQLEHPGRSLPYWRQVIEYCIDGNLQALLDEHLHFEADGLAQFDEKTTKKAGQAADAVYNALSIRRASIEVNGLDRRGRGQNRGGTIKLRCRYALRFAEIKEADGAVSRLDMVRAAFNSPFRPFVLASTAVGQEGLDFHPWCHAVVHWNLPRSPVELEQREGRVHRYKGHAVRLNVASATGIAAIAEATLAHASNVAETDPWKVMFAAAAQIAKDDPLAPYWVFLPDSQSVQIQRIIPMLACSREDEDWPRLKGRLATYRLVMGMPRHEDLLERLERNGVTSEQAQKWRIDLSPFARR